MKDFCGIFYKDSGKKSLAESGFLSFSDEKTERAISEFSLALSKLCSLLFVKISPSFGGNGA